MWQACQTTVKTAEYLGPALAPAERANWSLYKIMSVSAGASWDHMQLGAATASSCQAWPQKNAGPELPALLSFSKKIFQNLDKAFNF